MTAAITPPPAPLTGISVVELGDGTSAAFAAKLFGDFGAEVVKVEAPAGRFDSPARSFPRWEA